MIVGADAPIYELDMSGRRDELAKMSHFIIHAALDSVDMAVWVRLGMIELSHSAVRGLHEQLYELGWRVRFHGRHFFPNYQSP